MSRLDPDLWTKFMGRRLGRVNLRCVRRVWRRGSTQRAQRGGVSQLWTVVVVLEVRVAPKSGQGSPVRRGLRSSGDKDGRR